MFSETDEAFEAASRLVSATSEQLETHAVALALRLSESTETFAKQLKDSNDLLELIVEYPQHTEWMLEQLKAKVLENGN